MHATFCAMVDSFETEEDRAGVRFGDKVGYFWVDLRDQEIIDRLRRSLERGDTLEVTYDVRTAQIRDVLVR
jgi:hypothetical protein